MKNLSVLRTAGIINERVISDYSQMVKQNIHSWLQWAVTEAGRNLNLICVPETKLRFSEPLDPSEFGVLNKRKRSFIRVDIAFYESFDNFLGLAECVTFDEAHECFSTKEVKYQWLTIRDKLPYAIRHLESKSQFVVLIVILPINAKQVPWKTSTKEIDDALKTKKYFEKLSPRWKELTNTIRKDVDTRLIIINERETISYP